MPLSKSRMRERKRQDRLGLTEAPVKPNPGLIIQGNKIVGINPAITSKPRFDKPDVKPNDTIPDIDADGNVVPEYA